MTPENFSLTASKLQQEFRTELIRIADWWLAHTVDHERGGFYGEVGADNRPVKEASKGVILNARILWFFSEASLALDNADYHAAATRAFGYLSDYFFDKEFGGVYWELDADGRAINTKKQVYAHAFVIYALTAYYRAAKKFQGDKNNLSEQALLLAMNCFELLETKSIDNKGEGYLEAFTREWGSISDLRLSERDLNFPKSQNTHLHVLEAYTTLHLIHPIDSVRAALRYNIRMFDDYMIDRNTYHLRMFMDMQWQDHSPGYTYGHDIEAAWLIAKALESLGDENYRNTLMPSLLKVAEATLKEGVGQHGQVLDAYHFASKQISPDTVWWVQAEALVGFLFAYEQTRHETFFNTALRLWDFIKQNQIDKEKGEWLWLSKLDANQIDPQTNEPYYKVGFWKCPYHNGRAMIEASAYLESAKK